VMNRFMVRVMRSGGSKRDLGFALNPLFLINSTKSSTDMPPSSLEQTLWPVSMRLVAFATGGMSF
jgi:hypothetical protein